MRASGEKPESTRSPERRPRPRRLVRRRRGEPDDAQRDLTALRSAIVGPEHVGELLPEAVGLATKARERDLAIALEPAVTHAVTSVAKHRPELYAEALAPTIGAAVKRAVAEAIAAMLERFDAALENSLSVQSIRWRIEARRTGRPFAEVVVLRTLAYRVEQVFLVHEPTSLVLQHLVDPTVHAQSPDQLAAMLSAIDAFGREALAVVPTDAHLRRFELGDLVVWIGREPPLVLAAVVRGTATSELRAQTSDVLARVRITCQEPLADFSGEVTPFDIARPLLEPLLKAERRPAPRRAGVLLAVAAGVLAVLVGALLVRGRLHRAARARTESGYVTSLSREPGIVVDRVTWSKGLATIAGLRDPLAAPAEAVLAARGLPPASLALAPFVSLDPRIVERRARTVLRAPPSVTSAVHGSTLELAGVAPRSWIDDARVLGRAVPGVAILDVSRLHPEESLAALARAAHDLDATVITFDTGSVQLPSDQPVTRARDAARAARDAAAGVPTELCLDVVGHTDVTGTDERNRSLSTARAVAVAGRLATLGVDRSILHPSAGEPGARSVTFRLRYDPDHPLTPCGGAP